MMEIILSGGLVAVVDDEDFELVAKRRWRASWSRNAQSYYALSAFTVPERQSNPKLPCAREMHRFILDPDMLVPRNLLVDHIRREDTLDNRRCNIRWVNARESVLNRRLFRNNSTGYRGVFRSNDERCGARPYYTQLGSRGIRYHGGFHETAEAAALAYNRLALIHHGDFAVLNMVPSEN